MLVFTAKAIERIKLVTESSEFPKGYYVRVGLKGSACSGSYLFGLDLPTANDEIHSIQSLAILIDRSHLMYLIGIEIDFQLTEYGEGFTFKKNE